MGKGNKFLNDPLIRSRWSMTGNMLIHENKMGKRLHPGRQGQGLAGGNCTNVERFRIVGSHWMAH